MVNKRTLSEDEKVEVYERDGEQCRYCGTTEGPFEVDHVYPFSKGGETSVENSVVSCMSCNRHKHDKVGIWPRPLITPSGDFDFVSLMSWVAWFLITFIVGWIALNFDELIIRITASIAWFWSFVFIGYVARVRKSEMQ